MALFGKKKNTEPKAKKAAPKTPKPLAVKAERVEHATVKGENAAVLRAPRITEKASFAQEQGVYVFIVSPRATKRSIAAAVREIYNVVPRKINITKIPSKVVFNRRIRGVKSGGKKAYVYLKKGEKIAMV